MPIERTNFDEISEEDLVDLIQAAAPESLGLEYKRDPYGNSDAEKKEALKDVTSLANSSGGHLIIGMDESEGLPTELTGLPNTDPDALINRLEALVRDGVEPRIVGIRMRPIRLADGGTAVVIRVPKSWNPPHRVKSGGSNRFYVRNSGGAHEASVEELRVLFTFAADAQERIRSFHLERLDRIASYSSPVLLPTPSEGRLIVHLVPLSAFGQPTQVDLERTHQARNQFTPIGAAGISPRFNLDGFINVRGGSQPQGYTQIFRNGIVEATKTSILTERNGRKLLHGKKLILQLTEAIPLYLSGLQALDVSAPIVLMMSFQDVAHATLVIPDFEYHDGEVQPFPGTDAQMMMPEVIIDSYAPEDAYLRAMRPIFDALWNAAGLAKSPFYDSDGAWLPPS